MTELEKICKQQFSTLAVQSEPDWLQESRKKAINWLEKKGFPTRKTEHWKYTNVQPLLDGQWSHQFDRSELTIQDDNQVVFQNGVLVALPKVKTKGLIVCSIATAVEQYPHLVERVLNQCANFKADGFAASNLALFQNGIFIYVPKEQVVEIPIELVYNSNQPSMHHLRHAILLEPGASLKLVEQYGSDNTACYYNNVAIEVLVEANARFEQLKIEEENMASYHIASTHIKQKKDSQSICHSFCLGGKTARSDVEVSLMEVGASCTLNGLYMTEGKQHIDNHTSIYHYAAHTQSQEFYKGILNGQSRAVFNGKVHVAPDAQKVDSSQQNKNLLLNNNCEVDTKPELEIYADDVKCAHGATVGQLDAQALFYLQARGLNPVEAQSMMVEAFVEELIVSLPFSEHKETLSKCVLAKLGEVHA